MATFLLTLLLFIVINGEYTCEYQSDISYDQDIEWISNEVRRIAISFKLLTSQHLLKQQKLDSIDYAPELLVKYIAQKFKASKSNSINRKLFKQLQQDTEHSMTFINDHKLKSIQTNNETTNTIINNRYDWMRAILTSLNTKLKQILHPTDLSFDEESRKLYDIQVPNSYTNQTPIDKYFHQLMNILNITQTQYTNDPTIIYQKYSSFRNQYQISDHHYQTIFSFILQDVQDMFKSKFSSSTASILEQSTLQEIYFNDPSNSAEAYCSYKGNMKSTMHMNIARKITIEKCQQLTTHELTHHIHYVLLESIRKKYPEWQVGLHGNALAFVMEGCAELAVDLIWKKNERIKYLQEKILPLMGIDEGRNEDMVKLIEMDQIVTELWGLYTLVGKQVVSGEISEEDADWRMKYVGMKDRMSWPNVAFFKSYRSYIAGYGYGKLLIKQYLEAIGGCDEGNVDYYDCMWSEFEKFLIVPMTPQKMQNAVRNT